MASNPTTTTTSSGASASTLLQNSGSEEDLQNVMDQRKLKRMRSNRESARRSRQRKQKHVDDLIAQVGFLRKENSQILSRLNITTQHYLKLQSENLTLRSEVLDLTAKLHSLTNTLHYIEEISGLVMDIPQIPDPLLKPWQLPCINQPIMASADMFQY
ncbi:hypothetical protein AMTR_s00014p00097990 [Amborella trichopoda]|uniref:BZIP domain-containing protein n=2 Tax=Amborella trichopoda TaxID=13333 RepID=W1PM17_AMBTC|nr:hypothetical protein AMTR_s00014p00097990 [Amborella trichopoda]